jgi:transposase
LRLSPAIAAFTGWRRSTVRTSRGGRTSKLHAATDETGRPRLILLTAGNASDAATAPALLAALGPFRRLVADRGYDSDAIRRLIAERGAEAVIPASSPRVRQIPYDRIVYRKRSLITVENGG